MSTLTTNYSLVKPDRGEKDWDSDVNSNFDTIDTEIHALETGKVDIGSGAAVNVAALDSTGAVVDSGITVTEATTKRFHTFLFQRTSGALTSGEATLRMMLVEVGEVKSVGGCVRVVSSYGDIEVDVQYSTDNGASFTSLLSSPIVIPEGYYSSVDAFVQPEVVEISLPANTILRAYVTSTGTNAEDLNVSLSLEV